MLTTPRRHLRVYKSRLRGSALVGTLVMIGILALSVGVMLHSTTYNIRSSRDKIAYEEAYQAAISGTHIARAWLIDPELAAKHTGATGMPAEVEALIEKADQMSQDIMEDYSLADLSPSAVASKWFGGSGTVLADGRIVLYDNFPKSASGAVASLNYDKSNPQSGTSMFNSSNQDLKNYIEDVRITTLSPQESGNGALRQASFIIESKGVAEYAGVVKERTVQQRVLVYPESLGTPLLGADEALIINGSYGFGGQSHGVVRWGPALAASHIKMLNLTLSKDSTTGKYTLDAANKSVVGRGNVDDGQLKGEVDYWVKWMTGVNGELRVGTDSLFKPLPSGVVDLFSELYAGTIPGMAIGDLTLKGNYVPADGTDTKGLFDEYGGSLVEGSAAVDTRISDFFTRDADIAALKQLAIQSGTYVKWDSSLKAFTNLDNQALYVDATGGLSPYKGKNAQAFNSLQQISMDKILPNNQQNSPISVHSESTIPDRLLFVDAPGQTFDPSGFFWKGILYANCNLAGSGKGAASVYAKDPDQYVADPLDEQGLHKQLDNVMMDGILIANGTVNLGGNLTIYGTLASTNNVQLNGTPNVFYNSANAAGRMKKPNENPEDTRIIANRLTEADKWLALSADVAE